MLWDHECKPRWPPEPGSVEVSSEQQSQKLGFWTSVLAPFWDILLSCREAEGESKDGIHLSL